jgi:hypothetical protein
MIRVIKSRWMQWAGHRLKGMYVVLFRTSEGRRLPGRPRYRWEGNIRINLREIG